MTTTLRFHRSMYVATAIAEAVAVFADHGQVRLDDSDAAYIIVRLDALELGQDDALAGAFGNYALGASVHAHQRQAVAGTIS